MTGDMEHLSMYLVAICISTLVRCLLKSLAYILIGLFVFLLWLLSSLYILDNSPLFIRYIFGKYFLPVCAMSSYSLDIYLILYCLKACSFSSLVSLDCIFKSVVFILWSECKYFAVLSTVFSAISFQQKAPTLSEKWPFLRICFPLCYC